MNKYSVFFIALLVFPFVAIAGASDSSRDNTHHNRSWYVSWGYNKDYWSNSNIIVSQPDLENHFVIHNVRAGDFPGWDRGLIGTNLFSPQYNIRIGHYLNAAHTWGIEFSFDHTKYNTNLNQIARVTGTINGQPIDQSQVLTSQYFYYMLHNGANLFMFNAVRRKPLYQFSDHDLQFAALAKMGAGIVVPHPESTIFGNTSDVGPKTLSNTFGWRHGWWQFGGWVAGIEVGFQVLIHNRVYLELTDKEAFMTLSDIQVYHGSLSQNLWLNEIIGNLGVQF